MDALGKGRTREVTREDSWRLFCGMFSILWQYIICGIFTSKMIWFHASVAVWYAKQYKLFDAMQNMVWHCSPKPLCLVAAAHVRGYEEVSVAC